MPDPGKLRALMAAGYVVQPTCGTCTHFTDRGLGWGYCTAIAHLHEKTGKHEATGVRRDGVCPSYVADAWATAFLQRSGYDVFLRGEATRRLPRAT